MRRLFWVGVGAAGAVLVAGKVRAAARRYTPEGVAEQVGETGRRVGGALEEAVQQFRSAMATRERDLVSTLLVEPEAGDAGAVFRRRTDEPDRDRPSSSRRGPAGPGPAGRVDEDEPLYDF